MTLAESLFSNLAVNIKFFCDIHHNSSWVERKTKTDYTLWHIHQGTLWLEINGQKLTASKGDIVLFYPGDNYRAYTTENGCSFLVTFFTIETGNKLDLLENRLLAGIYHSESVQKLCTNFCQDYYVHFQNNVTPTLKQYASFISFFAELISDHTPRWNFHEVPSPSEKLPFHELLDYMNEHFLEPLPIHELADKMDMSEKYFIQYFHIHTATSPKQYLIEKRMKHALILLANPENSLNYTAVMLGYSDQYAFSKAFKKYYGEAPGSFRKHLL